MPSSNTSTTNRDPSPAAQPKVRRVLNAGSGPLAPSRLHAAFSGRLWKETRIDIDPRVKPDLIGSIVDMRSSVPDAAFDAIWSSHNLEHLHTYQVLPALGEFRRILKEDGFAVVTCPDLEALATLVLQNKVDVPIYDSPIGPITALDMLYGHSASIAGGNMYMAHNTAFTTETLGRLALSAGFQEVRIASGEFYDIWAVAMMPDTDHAFVKSLFSQTPQSYLFTDV